MKKMIILLFIVLISSCFICGCLIQSQSITPKKDTLKPVTQNKVDNSEVSPTKPVISTIPNSAGPNVCERGGNGLGSEWFTVMDPGVRTFTITHVGGFHFFIELFKRVNTSEPAHSIRYLAKEKALEKNEDICYNQSITNRLYVSERYWTRKDFVTLNTTEFLDAGLYHLEITICGPWTISIAPCTEQRSYPSDDQLSQRSAELVRGKPIY